MEIPRVGVPDTLAKKLSIAEQHNYLLKGRIGRRGLMRGAAVTAGAAALGPFGAGPLLAAHASRVPGNLVIPFARHLAFGPDPSRQMNVGWQVPALVDSPFLRIGTEPWDLGHKIAAEIRPLHSEVPILDSTGTTITGVSIWDQYYVHASIAGLSPGRTYYYAVGHNGYDPRDLTTFGNISSFTTAPDRNRVADAFTFTAFGDQGVSYNALSDDGAIAGQNPVFHLLAGDIAYADPSGEGLPVATTETDTRDQYDPRIWDQYLAQIESISASVPWMVATGNHDMEALYSPNGYGGQEARFDFPGNGPKHCPSVYSFVYGNVGVISLDANDVSNEIPANLGYSGGTQTSWLDAKLKELRGDPAVDFIVVFFHHCAYSTTNQHASEGGVRAAWVPLFDKHQVDLVVNGHNHIYERSDPLRGGVSKAAPIGSTINPRTDGTTYLAVGGGGKSLYSFPVPDSYEGHEIAHTDVPSYYWVTGGGTTTETVDWSRVRYTGYSFIAVDVVPARSGHLTTLTVRALTQAGVEIDRVTLRRTA